jgi:hypothetical protein
MCCDRTALAAEARAYAQAVAKKVSERATNMLLANPKPNKFNPGPGSLIGLQSDHHLCIDCGFNTAPGCSTRVEMELAFMDGRDGIEQSFTSDSEIYMVKDKVWQAAGMEPYGGCLCIGCLEKRIGRRLRPKDFSNHIFNSPAMPGTERLLQRRGRP